MPFQDVDFCILIICKPSILLSIELNPIIIKNTINLTLKLSKNTSPIKNLNYLGQPPKFDTYCGIPKTGLEL